jgi:hypothetical protein
VAVKRGRSRGLGHGRDFEITHKIYINRASLSTSSLLSSASANFASMAASVSCSSHYRKKSRQVQSTLHRSIHASKIRPLQKSSKRRWFQPWPVNTRHMGYTLTHTRAHIHARTHLCFCETPARHFQLLHRCAQSFLAISGERHRIRDPFPVINCDTLRQLLVESYQAGGAVRPGAKGCTH